MTRRYFSSQPLAERVSLDGDEAHHLLHVMRGKPGDELVLFDGSGDEATARVVKASKKGVECLVVERRSVDRELDFSLTLAAALPKGDRQRVLIEKAVELGCTTLVPLTTERGVAQPVDSALERLGRTVIEASKQCGRNKLMAIAPAAAWTNYVRAASPEALRLVGSPAGESSAASLLRTRSPEVIVAVGPEGGFSEAEEQAAAAAGWRLATLGPRILRVETAAAALLSFAIAGRVA